MCFYKESVFLNNLTDFVINNRKKFLHEMEDCSIAILFADEPKHKYSDEYYEFTPNRNFYYLTGIDEPSNILLIVKLYGLVDEYIFTKRPNKELEKWIVTHNSSKKISDISGIVDVKYLDEFDDVISDIMLKNNIKNLYLDVNVRDFKNFDNKTLQFQKAFRDKYFDITILNCYETISDFREIKSEYEINLIKKALDITKKGIYEVMKNAQPNMPEYELEAHFAFILNKNNIKHKAFPSICASGSNATILHYCENDNIAKDGDLVLLDVGAQFGWYNADLTRTFPVNGKFTEEQKTFYNIVLEGQKTIINSIKPGMEFSLLNEILKNFYYIKLRQLNMINSKDELNKYYYHSVSHYLGAETHDVGKRVGRFLQEGMVLTVEPGLYIKEKNIGIRIEDDILVTKNGCIVLSDGMIKEISEIEEFMASK